MGHQHEISARSSHIEVDGHLLPTRNSAGHPIHATEDGIRNFWRWFGSSAVKDQASLPIVAYHGSTKGTDFDAFRVPAFFTNSPEFAGRYSCEDGAIYPVYLSLKNPVEIDALEHELGGDAEELANNPQWVDACLAAGHDGLMVHDGAVVTFVAFRQDQIKSALGNSGAFSPDSSCLCDYRPVLPVTGLRDRLLAMDESLDQSPAGAAAGPGCR